ncbi:MAG: hypothetical protein JXA96_03520 [Sedimentisphaerales bacterium]|nr:hypothetical protein [Sedimentisphaerales bacterium]
MKVSDTHKILRAKCILTGLIILGLTSVCMASLSTEDKIYKHYNVEINLFSFNPTEPIDSYQQHGSGNAGVGGKVSLGCPYDGKIFRVNIGGKNQNGHFIVNVSVEPSQNDSEIKEDSFEVDFTDLKPKGFELAKNDNVRVCMLSLVPSVKIIDNRPKRVDENSLGFSIWSLVDSMIIFNDSVYAGKMGCVGGPLAFLSYPGYAKVEFALVPFRDAKRLGTLKNGKIQIRAEDGQTLEIYGVKNGKNPIQLPGGPYEVWVRWQALPEQVQYDIPSKEDFTRMINERYAEMGDTPPTGEELDILYERAKHQMRNPLSHGVGPIH